MGGGRKVEGVLWWGYDGQKVVLAKLGVLRNVQILHNVITVVGVDGQGGAYVWAHEASVLNWVCLRGQVFLLDCGQGGPR